ncbi:Cyclic pyranopterin monophosphate synthase [Novipirellula aureliae]|uniref:GTP 3',8-cyclase n=1 Tax=Novipirellula aureliae TaxID=2527966 RepID=A0A5C6EC54_9BACT|nr:GTP 3',8-cyclase MoaA [Novipirellula aureliae]TWU45351.1 Cyclic pyranopterin monophosphate synthase [Novipirellula aureliae]
MLIDRFGRVHTSLRISVTDRCNLRCTYCMPAATPDYQERSEILSFEEIERFVQIAAGLGVDDVRVTGGEPLVRAELWNLMEKIVAVKGLEKVSLTTNGILLSDQLERLFAAGLRSVNVSLDALDEASFRQATRRPGLQKVLDGIDRAISIGMSVKINSIAMQGLTEFQIKAFAALTKRTGIPVRFIEFMPLDSDANWEEAKMLSGAKILDLFREQVGVLEKVEKQDSSPATDYRFVDSAGCIGIVPSVSEPFCSTCNRLRLTADGQLRSCLFGEDSGDVKSLMRSGATDEVIAEKIKTAVLEKKAGHGTDDLSFRRPSRPMYSIGG